jgi:hypothetical protein
VIEDSIPATIEVTYSNIGEEWCAVLLDENGRTLASARSQSRADALRELADEIDS